MSTLMEAGWIAYAQVAACALGLVWTLACAVMLGLRWKVPAVVSVAPLGLHAILVIVGAALGSSAVTGAVGADPAQVATLAAAGFAQVLAAGTFAAVALPGAVLLGLGGAAGGARAPRAFGAPFLAFVACALAAILPLGGLFFYASFPMVAVKVLLYGAGALPVAVALLGNGQNTNARESSVAAAIAYFGAVACVELVDRSASWSRVFSAIAYADPESRAALMAAGGQEIADVARFGWASLGLALVPLLCAVLRPAAPLTEDEVMNGQVNPSGFRILATGFGLVVPLLWFAALLSSDPSAAMGKILAGG